MMILTAPCGLLETTPVDFSYNSSDSESQLWGPRGPCLSQECRNRYLHTSVDFLYNSNGFESLLWVPRDPCLSQDLKK